MFETPFIIKNFVEKEIIDDLNNWCLANYKKDFFKDASMGLPGTRLTTRYSNPKTFDYPKSAYELRNKIANHLKLKNDFIPPYKDGIVCGIGFEKGSIHEHIDPIWHDHTITLHCNVITQKSKIGGITVINDIEYETNTQDLLIYSVSSFRHRVTEIQGNTPRILWVSGFSVSNPEKMR